LSRAAKAIRKLGLRSHLYVVFATHVHTQISAVTCEIDNEGFIWITRSDQSPDPLNQS